MVDDYRSERNSSEYINKEIEVSNGKPWVAFWYALAIVVSIFLILSTITDYTKNFACVVHGNTEICSSLPSQKDEK